MRTSRNIEPTALSKSRRGRMRAGVESDEVVKGTKLNHYVGSRDQKRTMPAEAIDEIVGKSMWAGGGAQVLKDKSGGDEATHLTGPRSSRKKPQPKNPDSSRTIGKSGRRDIKIVKKGPRGSKYGG